jgi:hypothetical protein
MILGVVGAQGLVPSSQIKVRELFPKAHLRGFELSKMVS